MSSSIALPNILTNESDGLKISGSSGLVNQYTDISLSNDIEANRIIVIPSTNKTETNKYERLSCFGAIIFLIFAIGLVGLAITYIVYVIISLCQTSYNEQKDMCANSNVWLYLLLSIILGTMTSSLTTKSRLNSNHSSKSKNNLNSILPGLIQVLYGLTFTIWGCIELFGVNCVGQLKHTLLYTMMEVSVFANIVSLGLELLISLVMCCFVNQIN
jgi:hypothetical protein